MNGLGDMMNKSVAAMREMQGEFGRLVTDLRQTGQSSTEEMAKKLGEMMDQADTRQKLLEDQMRSVVKALEGQRSEAAKAERLHLGELADKTKVFVDGLSSETTKLSAEVLNTAQAMSMSIDKMNLGAQKMLDAATKFKDAGLAVTGVMQQGVSTMSELRDASTQVSSASRELAGILTNAQNAQQTMQGMVSALQNLIDQTKREAGVSKHIVDDMNKVAVTLKQVEQQTQQYLAQMTKLTDSYLFNLDLSLKRAHSVLCALFDDPAPGANALSHEEKLAIRKLFLVGAIRRIPVKERMRKAGELNSSWNSGGWTTRRRHLSLYRMKHLPWATAC